MDYTGMFCLIIQISTMSFLEKGQQKLDAALRLLSPEAPAVHENAGAGV